jgi:hypothetical protein
MQPDDLFQLLAPIFKANPWLNYALVLGMAVAAGWKMAPARVVAWVRAKSPRAAGLLDAAVAAVPTAPAFVGALWHGVVLGKTKPSRMTRAELDALIASELAKVTPVPPAPTPVAIPVPPGESDR